MCTIVFIASCHKDRGNCNSEELFKIIDQINPEVIFEELPPDGFAEIYERNRTDHLETKAIKLYIQSHSIDHFPVDLDANQYINKALKNEIEGMFEHFTKSWDYMNTRHQINTISEHHGFAYLNSDHCQQLMDQRHRAERFVLKTLNNERLFQVYEFWLRFNDRRDSEMIKNIYAFCKTGKYKKALFLAGAEHRKSIMQIVPMFEKDNDQKLNWIFNYDQEQADLSLLT